MVYAGFSHLTLIGLTFRHKYRTAAAKQRLSGLVIRYSRNSFGSWISFLEKGTSNIWLGTCVILRFVFPGNNIAVPRPKDAFAL
jgi:hypothetical protein